MFNFVHHENISLISDVCNGQLLQKLFSCSITCVYECFVIFIFSPLLIFSLLINISFSLVFNSFLTIVYYIRFTYCPLSSFNILLQISIPFWAFTVQFLTRIVQSSFFNLLFFRFYSAPILDFLNILQPYWQSFT